jgi:glycosyltransferase involved in cell wall biosynthesis
MVNASQTGGGAGRAAETLAAELRRGGDRVNAIVSANVGDDPHWRRGGHWREARLANWLAGHGLTDLGHLSSFLWRCRQDFASADVLHWHNLHGNYLSILAAPCWGLDKPIVWTLHDFWPLTGNCATPRDCTRWRRSCGRCPLVGKLPMGGVDRSRLYRRLKPRLFAAARPVLVTPSRWLADRVREVPALSKLPLRVIPHRIDFDVFKPTAERESLRRRFGLDPDAPTVVMAGHTWNDPFKGGEQAIRALRAAQRSVGDLQLLIAGEASDRLLAATGLPGRALPFVEVRETLAAAYSAADVCLFPSLAENYPVTMLESMACATPVAAFAVGGIPEQIEQGRTGHAAGEGDVDDLAAGLMRIVSDFSRAREMGEAARAFVLRNCRSEITVARYRQTYREAIGAWMTRRQRRSPRYERGRIARLVARGLGWDDVATPTAAAVSNARIESAVLGGAL